MRRIAFARAACLAMTVAGAAHAQTVADCDWRARADAIVEPWEENSRTYANGAIRVALLDTIEPAAAAYHLLVLSPPYGPLGDRQCKVVSLDGSLGFAGLDFSAISASYNPARGLTVSLPGTIYLPDEGFSNSIVLSVTINQASGAVTPEIEPVGRE